jgi:S1-C subfamily serine protease
LEQVYDAVSPSIVAFGSRLSRSRDGVSPPFPDLLGTGFFIDSRGIVVTNRHVAEEILKLPPHPKTAELSSFALVSSSVHEEREGHGLSSAMIDLKHINIVSSLITDREDYYGDPLPDIAFIQLDVGDVPALELAAQHWSCRVGMSVATAGFAMGNAALTIYGSINSVTPLLRHGIVSSVFPFPCPTPHGFTVDVMTQGGESGSPIFLTDMPVVVGLLHAGFDNTNVTIAIPSLMVREAFRALNERSPYDFSGVPTLEHYFANRKSNNRPSWEAV